MIQFILLCNDISKTKTCCFIQRTQVAELEALTEILSELRGNFHKTGKIHLKYIYSTN